MQQYLSEPHEGPRDKTIMLHNMRQIELVAAYNANAAPESTISEIVKDPTHTWEDLTPISGDLAELQTPLDYVLRNYANFAALNAPNKGFPSPNDTPKKGPKKGTKKTAVQAAQKVVENLEKNHARKNIKKSENSEIVWGHSADGSHDCSPFWLPRYTSDGRREIDTSYCPSCGQLMRYRTHCNNPRCSQKYCLDAYTNEKAAAIAAKTDRLAEITRGGKMQSYHIVVSLPPSEASEFIQSSWGYAQFLRIASDIALGAGFLGLAGVTHTHRGRKARKGQETTIFDTEKDVDDIPEFIGRTKKEYAGQSSEYYWRVGPHIHFLGIAFQPYPENWLKAYCKAIYERTGVWVGIWRHDSPRNLINYVLSHAGIPMKAGTDRALPVLRVWGILTSRKGLQEIDLGTAIEVRSCKCPQCKGQPLETLKNTPSTRRFKLTGYIPRYPKDIPNPTLEAIVQIKAAYPSVPYWDIRQHPIVQRVISPPALIRLLNLSDLYVARENIPRYLLGKDPEEPSELPELNIPYKVTSDYPSEDCSSEASEDCSSRISRAGQLYDMYELMGFLEDEPHNRDVPMAPQGPNSGAPRELASGGGPARRPPQEGAA